MKKIVSDCSTGVVSIVDLTIEEVVTVELSRANNLKATPTTQPTKEQLLAELATLTAKIQALA